jgi:predicted transcriptional regulator
MTRRLKAAPPSASGLGALRRIGAVSDLLFLYECTTHDVGQLRAVAEPLGLTVQAASHTFRGLARRGLVELREGRYRPTVAGVAWIHATLGGLEKDLAGRLERLHIIRTTHALARAPINKGESVVLSVEDGALAARPGTVGPSRGTARDRARPGELVEVVELEGIVPLRRGAVRVAVLPSPRVRDPSIVRSIAAAFRGRSYGLLAAQGLEAFHRAGQAFPGRPVVRFGIAAAVDEASRLGVDCALVVVDHELPRLLTQLEGPHAPPLEFVSLVRAERGGRRSG